MHRECLTEQGWKVLDAIKDTMAKYKAVLAGGTALALQIGHRISIDLDFFTNVAFRTDSIISAIRKTGQKFRLLSEGEDYIVTDIEGVKFSLFKYDYPFLAKIREYEGISIAGILDIAAMKIIAISQRGTKRDFVDTYFILQEIPFHKVAEHMVRRFGKERINPILIGKALVYFADADSNPDPKYAREEVRWEKVRDFFRKHAKQFVLDLSAALGE